MDTEFAPRVLMGSNGKSDGEEVYACKRCGAMVAECDIQQHTNWHEGIRLQARARAAGKGNDD